ncbi:MAG: large repetitive protein, partial [Acidimicrobiaceae bacterium]|nr:large repetitive protein [Acidimicrobiaceae bacterium]
MVAILGLSNVAPSAVNDAYAAVEDVPLVVSAGAGVLGNDTDSDGDTLSAAIKTGPAHGAVSLAPNGSFTYTPAPDFNGADAFTYTASDPYGGTGTAAVALTVAAVNDAPVASAASLTTAEDTAGQVALGATDAEGDPLTFDVASGPSHGQLGCTVACTSPVAYTPAADYNGPDQFTYTASDGTADSNSAVAAITVNAVNDPPVAADDAAGTDEGGPVTFDAVGNDSDTEGAVA